MRLPSRVYEVLERITAAHQVHGAVSDRTVAEFVFTIARLECPRHILEIGTGEGYTAIALGAAARSYGGTVTTIERNGERVERARRSIMDAGLHDTVTVYPGSAYKVLRRLSGPFSFVYIDATRQEYAGYLERALPLLSSPAAILAANALEIGQDILPFTETMMLDERFSSCLLPIGSGLLFAAFSADEPARSERMSPMRELVAHATTRVFRGTTTDVQTGAIFRAPAACEQNTIDPTFDGYEQSLADEALRLPSEE